MNVPAMLAVAAEAALLRGEVERARSFVERASLVDRRSPEVMAVRGLIALSRGDFRDAERSFRKALEGGVVSPRAYCGLGLALADSGQFEHAHQSFVFATQVARDPNDRWRLRALAEIRRLESRR